MSNNIELKSDITPLQYLKHALRIAELRGVVISEEEAEYTCAEMLKLSASPGTEEQHSTVSMNELYHATNNLLAALLLRGDIGVVLSEVEDLTEALFKIDGGEHDPESDPFPLTDSGSTSTVMVPRGWLEATTCPDVNCIEGRVLPEGDQCQWCDEKAQILLQQQTEGDGR